MRNPDGKGHYDERATVRRLSNIRLEVSMNDEVIGFVYRKSYREPLWRATGSRENYTRKQAIAFLVFAKLAKATK